MSNNSSNNSSSSSPAGSSPAGSAEKTHRVITLTDRGPVRILEADWPTIAHVTLADRRADYDERAAHRPDSDTRVVLAVRQHRDGRAIVYGIYERLSQVNPSPPDLRERAGELLAAAAAANLPAAIKRVGDTLIEQGADEAFVEPAIRACIGELPPVDL